MSTPQSGSASPATTAAAAVETSKHWAPHGPMLTACLVSINVLMILLIFFYFWRFFSGKRGPSSPGGADETGSSTDSSPATSPRASRRLRDPDQPDIPSSLPVSVFDSSSEAAGKAAADCAVCIVEFRDGDWRASSLAAGTGSTPPAWTRGCIYTPRARSAAPTWSPLRPPPPSPRTTQKTTTQSARCERICAHRRGRELPKPSQRST